MFLGQDGSSKCPRGCLRLRPAGHHPSQPGPARVLLRGIAPTARPRQSWVRKQRKVLVFGQRAQRCYATFILNGKTEKLTQRAPCRHFSIFLFPSQCKSSKVMSLPTLVTFMVHFHWTRWSRWMSSMGHLRASAARDPAAASTRETPSCSLVSLPLVTVSHLHVHRPLSDRIWLLVSLGAVSSRQVGTDVGHCLL